MYSKYSQLITSKTLICARKSLLCKTVPEPSPFQCKRSEKKWQCLKVQTSGFHTTQKLHFHTPVILCLGSILAGHFIRKRWLRMSPIEQEIVIRWYKQRRHIFHGCIKILSAILIIYLATCIKRDPILKVPRFVLFNEAQRIQNAKFLFKVVVQNESNVVPHDNHMYRKVAKIIKKLTNANKEIFKDIDWDVTIIYRIFNIASIPNVLILPDRHIIILADIFNLIKSDDQLAFILAHEMSHEMLYHPSQTISLAVLSNDVILISTFLIWTFYPARIAAMLCSFMYIVQAILFAWFKRGCEREADKVGLRLAAKSCIDLREILTFWEIMKMYDELTGASMFRLPFLNEHPSLEERKNITIQLMPKMNQLRDQVGCPELPLKDPRDYLPQYKRELEDELRRNPRFLGMRW
ncbi:Metalloendopeptidase OMA1, mitochondrial [Anthophora quadrimaculata]